MIDLFDGAHTGGKDDRLALGAGVAQQMVVGERRRRDLVAGRIELVDEVDRFLVPAGGEPRHLDFAAVAVDQAVLVVTEFQAALEVAIGGSEGAFPRLRQLFRRVHYIDRALLELDRVAAGRHRHADEPPGQIDVAVVVDADFGDDVARMAVANHFVADRNFGDIGVALHDVLHL